MRKVVILDWSSGGFVEGKGVRDINTGANFDRGARSFYIYGAANSPGHKINPAYTHSLFTHHLLEGLRGGAETSPNR